MDYIIIYVDNKSIWIKFVIVMFLEKYIIVLIKKISIVFNWLLLYVVCVNMVYFECIF